MDQDFHLVWKIRHGEDQAMDQLVRKYYPVILKYCKYHIYNQTDAEDLVQETFVRFFQSFSSYKHHDKLLNYLYRIAGNLCTDYYRRHVDESSIDEMQPDESCLSKNQIEKVDEQVEVRRAIQELSDELREVIILYYFEDLKLKEIAQVLEIGLPLVKYRIRQAKEQLRQQLGEEDWDE